MQLLKCGVVLAGCLVVGSMALADEPAKAPAAAPAAATPAAPAPAQSVPNQTAPAAAPGAESKPEAAVEEPLIGKKAPELGIAHWVKGSPVKTFEPGKAYVVEFWATWCAPCVRNIPHLTDLQAKYKDKGLTVIGVSSADRNGVEDVRPFVENMGTRMDYTVAVDDAMKTSNAYMGAVGAQGIPHAFVVDKQGKVAWHGHPQDAMDLVIDQVVSGTFDPAKHRQRAADLQVMINKFRDAATAKDWVAAEKALDEIGEARPDQRMQAELIRVSLLLGGKQDRAAAMVATKRFLDSDLKNNLEAMRSLGEMLVGAQDKLEKADYDLLLAVAQQAIAAGKNNDMMSWILMSDVRKLRGEYTEAGAALDKAMEKADTEATKMAIKAKKNQLEADQHPGESKPDQAEDNRR